MLAKKIDGLYKVCKAKLIYRSASWKTKESLEVATSGWEPFFDHHRWQEPIGYIAPVKAEANYHWQLASQVSIAEA